jgi:hypothetical protein
VLGKQLQQQLIPEAVVSNPFSREHPSGVVNKGNVVVIFSPMNATIHRQ